MNRQKEILKLAKSLIEIPEDALQAAFIDAQFFFRFERGWCKWVSRIRSMMRTLIGEKGDKPLSTEIGAKLVVHLKTNSNISVGFTSKGLMINSARSEYRIFNKELRQQYKAAYAETIREGNSLRLEQLHGEVWMEANQTAKIWDELYRLGRAYNLIPSEHKSRNYALSLIKDQFLTLVNHVVWGEVFPSFLWSQTLLLESPTDQNLRRTLRPHKWTKDSWGTPEPVFLDGTTRTRIRTWTIYYLTRRGGGDLTEQQAVDLWNSHFNDSLDVRNFRKNRDRLLKHS